VRTTIKRYHAAKRHRQQTKYNREINELVKDLTLHQLGCTVQFIRLMRNLP
jgi:ribosomal protein L35